MSSGENHGPQRALHMVKGHETLANNRLCCHRAETRLVWGGGQPPLLRAASTRQAVVIR